MDTPICDFVRDYAVRNALRLHMPGHKGAGALGVERLDITEIEGADSLYEAGGIIRQSEENAGRLFGAPTLYSTEGSSLCIRAMLYLASLHCRQCGKPLRIAAVRNAHKTFLSACALLDLDVCWLDPSEGDSYLSCRLSASRFDAQLTAMGEKPAALYITSPDYLGEVADIPALSAVCRRHDMLLLVDNAHGAYLKFLSPSMHPIDLGADMCCDSAHKTLPVLTGGAYLHIARHADSMFAAQAKKALALFGSTSPSYLILQSLDAANAILAGEYPAQLNTFAEETAQLKARLAAYGFALKGAEPLKLTISVKPYGYTGRQLADTLLEENIVCEFSDPDFVVMMLTPEIGRAGLGRLERALLAVVPKEPIGQKPPGFHRCKRVLSIREAALSPCEDVPVKSSVGRTLAAPSVGCPPAVPIVICGEQIDEDAVRCFAYYGIETCTVVARKTDK